MPDRLPGPTVGPLGLIGPGFMPRIPAYRVHRDRRDVRGISVSTALRPVSGTTPVRKHRISLSETTTATTPETSTETSTTACPACPHDESAHDRIGLRYCAATSAGALERGCVCVGDTLGTRGPRP